MDDVVSYKCPNCASSLRFDAATNRWACEYCQSSFSLAEMQGKTEERQEPLQSAGASQRFGAEATVFHCPNCGGSIITDNQTTASFCAYCHSPSVIASRFVDEYRPARLIPFQLSRQQALESLRSFCKNKPFLPPDFRGIAERGEITGLYVPFWVFDCDVDAQMQGEAKNISSWSDSKYRYTKTDTYRVERAGSMSFAEIPADGSEKLDDELMQALEPFDYSKMVDFTMEYLSGFFAHSYDVDADSVSAQVFSRLDSFVASTMRDQVQGYSSVQVSKCTSERRNLRVQYVLLPVWLLMTQYNGKSYLLALNGQTGKMVGRLPTSGKRMLAWSGGIFAVSSLVVALIAKLGGWA